VGVKITFFRNVAHARTSLCMKNNYLVLGKVGDQIKIKVCSPYLNSSWFSSCSRSKQVASNLLTFLLQKQKQRKYY